MAEYMKELLPGSQYYYKKYYVTRLLGHRKSVMKFNRLKIKEDMISGGANKKLYVVNIEGGLCHPSMTGMFRNDTEFLTPTDILQLANEIRRGCLGHFLNIGSYILIILQWGMRLITCIMLYFHVYRVTLRFEILMCQYNTESLYYRLTQKCGALLHHFA
jgi:hypothetical protein